MSKGDFLDRFDQRLLAELDMDSRQQVTRLAKKLKTSPQRMHYRLKSLFERGIIDSCIPMIDYKAAGYTMYTTYYTLRDISPRMLGRMITQLKHDSHTCIIQQCEGKWDLAVGVLAKDPADVNDYLLELRSRFGRFQLDRTTLTQMDAHYLGRRYLLPEEEQEWMTKDTVTGKRTARIDLSEEDENILHSMAGNARISTLELVEKTGLSIDSIRYRLRQLERKGMIMRYVLILDFEHYPCQFFRTFISFQKYSEDLYEKMWEYLKNHPNVTRTTLTFGRYDLVIDTEMFSSQENRQFMLELRDKFADLISHYDTLKVLKAVKVRYYPEQ